MTLYWPHSIDKLQPERASVDGCHRGRPLVGFPWFSLQPKRPRVSLFDMVPVGLEPSTGLLGLVGHLRVVSWSKG